MKHHNANPQHKRILYAEDQQMLRELTVLFLKQRLVGDYELRQVSSGEELLATGRRGAWDLLITDMQMHSQMNGYDALKALRAEGIMTPAIVYSSRHPDAPLEKMALSLKNVNHLMKGKDMYELPRTINRMLWGMDFPRRNI